MSNRLSVQDKIDLINRISAGQSVSHICESAGISRTIFYKWLKLYNASSEEDISFTFLPKYKKGIDHWHKVSNSLEKKIIRLALRNPTWSPVQLSKHLPCSSSLIWTILKRKGFNTIALRQQHSLLYGQRITGQLSTNYKLTLIKRYQAGESVTSLTKSFRISRTAFYQWLKLYQRASKTAKQSVFKSVRPSGSKHWKHISGSKELVLEVVIEHPDFSAHKIRDEIVRKFGKQILSSYTVHIILKELGLTTFEGRLAFVASKLTVGNLFPGMLNHELTPKSNNSFTSSVSPPLFDEIASQVRVYIPFILLSSVISFVFLSIIRDFHWFNYIFSLLLHLVSHIF